MNTMLGVLLLAVTAPPPALTADAATVDRGDVTGGTILKQTFRVTNRGAEAVILTGLDSGCGCLRRSVSKNDLKPGDAADVTLEINTLTQPDGPQAWLAKVKYRPAAAAKMTPDDVLELRLVAKLSRQVSVTPPMLSVSTEGEAATSITIADARKTPFAVKKVASSSPHLTAKLKPSADAGKFVLDVAVADALPVGTHDETLIVTTTDPEYAELQIPARIVKRGKNAVTAYPESLDIEGGAGVVQFRRGGKPVAIASAECVTPGVTMTTSSGSGAVATLKVRVSTKAGKADVRVKFSEPAETELVVPVKWGQD
jgi:hypothetical protein